MKPNGTGGRHTQNGTVDGDDGKPPTLEDADDNIEGLNRTESGGVEPPDTEGAIGRGQYVEVVNSALRVYDEDSGGVLKTVSFQSFFGANLTIYDPRVLFDSRANRWLVIADTGGPNRPDEQSPTVQHFFIGVSQTADATGAFFIYDCNISLGDVVPQGTWLDFPMIGLNRAALILTGNVYSGYPLFEGPFIGQEVVSIPKADLYRGRSFAVPRFVASQDGTLAPPYVLDKNPSAYLIQAVELQAGQGDVSVEALHLYRLKHTGDPRRTSLTALPDVPIEPYWLPQPAGQPGTDVNLEVVPNRFVDESTQSGNSLWQVHTIAEEFLGLPTPRFYEVKTAASKLKQSGEFALSRTSYDFNASIAANKRGMAFVTWTATDPQDGIYPQVRFSGRRPTDPAGSMNSPGRLLYQSTTFYEGGPPAPEPDPFRCPGRPRCARWGDYSDVSIDPTDADDAFIVNETVLSPTTWGSRIGEIGYGE